MQFCSREIGGSRNISNGTIDVTRGRVTCRQQNRIRIVKAMPGYLLLLSSPIVFLLLLAVAEVIRHRRKLRSVPIRVHVNGTRGKSSVTRLIAAGLRESGIRTIAKTTGTLPRLILPDGSELPIERTSRANVIEQRDVVAAAAHMRAEVLVVECMALQPQLQWLCEACKKPNLIQGQPPLTKLSFSVA